MGARGPLGLSRAGFAMALRANKLEPFATSFKDRRDQEIGVALTGGLGSHLFGFQRMVALAAPALAETAHTAPAEAIPTADAPWPVVLCLPEPGRADDSKRFAEDFISELERASGVVIDHARSSLVRHGHAGFAHAIQAAIALLKDGAALVCVGGVDSYYHPQVLTELDTGFRVHAIGADDGFIPSEAAAFLLIRPASRKGNTLGRILTAEVGEEVTATNEEVPNQAAAMTSLLRKTREACEVDWAITDINGERHRHREWSKARQRTAAPDAQDQFWVTQTGDVGAATGALFATVALTLCELGCSPFDRAMVAMHSDGTARGVVTVEGVEHV